MEYKVYKRRWLVLIAAVVTNIAGGMVSEIINKETKEWRY